MSAEDKQTLDDLDYGFAAHLAETASDDVHDLITDGKIIEEVGSNANGKYIRFADGTQICYAEITMAYSTTNVLSAPWVFPAEFFETPKVIHMLNRNVLTLTNNIRDMGLTVTRGSGKLSTVLEQHIVNGHTGFGTGDEATTDAYAIGRWK